jgi:sulfopyruvate decarboxylase subunit alpha
MTQGSEGTGMLDGRAIIDAMRSAGLDTIVSLPDITTSAGLLWPISKESDIRLVRVCKEDEGVSICAALALCRKRSALLMQQTGLFDSLNAVRGIAVEYKLPVCMFVGLLGKEPGVAPPQNKRYSVRVVQPVLDAMEVPNFCIEDNRDIAKIGPAVDRAYAESQPVVVLFGRRVQP